MIQQFQLPSLLDHPCLLLCFPLLLVTAGCAPSSETDGSAGDFYFASPVYTSPSESCSDHSPELGPDLNISYESVQTDFGDTDDLWQNLETDDEFVYWTIDKKSEDSVFGHTSTLYRAPIDGSGQAEELGIYDNVQQLHVDDHSIFVQDFDGIFRIAKDGSLPPVSLDTSSLSPDFAFDEKNIYTTSDLNCFLNDDGTVYRSSKIRAIDKMSGATTLLAEVDCALELQVDGEYLYYTSQYVSPEPLPAAIYRIPLVGGTPELLFENLHSVWSLSIEGVVVTATGIWFAIPIGDTTSRQLFFMGKDGSQRQEYPQGCQNLGYPKIYQDKVLVGDGNTLFLLDQLTHQTQTLVFPDRLQFYSMHISGPYVYLAQTQSTSPETRYGIRRFKIPGY
jgi:hypothetical protein